MNKIRIVSWIAMVAAVAWICGQWELLEARKSFMARQAKLAAAQQQIDADRAALESARREQERESRAHTQLAAAVAGTRRELAEADPDSQWATLPTSLPEWNPNSPYIWLRKDALPSLNVSALNWRGKLDEDGANLLGLDEESRVKLNQQVQSALDEFHSQQNSNAVVTNTMPNGRPVDGPVVTVQLPAAVEAGQTLQEQIAQILEQNIGPDRTAMLTNAAADWLNGFTAQEPSAFSVMQHSNGTYYIYSKIGNDYHDSDGVPASVVSGQIPQNLASFFTNILPPPADSP